MQSATSAYRAPVLRDQGPIGRPGTARPILALTACMPCSFGLLPHPRSEPCILLTGLLEVTVTDRWYRSCPLLMARGWHERPGLRCLGLIRRRPARHMSRGRGGRENQLARRASEREKDAIRAYVEDQAHEEVVHLEKAASELVGPVRHDIWDVH